MIDKNNIYFFYNVYGDADELIKLAPENVILVPFGWDEKTESYRNKIIEEIGITPSCLPSVVAWRKEDQLPPTITMEGLEGPAVTIESRWLEIPVGKSPKYLWNWMHIMAIVGEWNNG